MSNASCERLIVRWKDTSLKQGSTWYEYGIDGFRKHYRTPLSIAFAFVATHNHFVLDRGGKVFNRTAPIIKLPADATEDDHLALLGLLNSSTACFWMKQVCSRQGKQRDRSRGSRRSMGEAFMSSTRTKLEVVSHPEEPHPTLFARLANSTPWPDDSST